MEEEQLELSYIETEDDPFNIFNKWYSEVIAYEKVYLKIYSLNIASATRNGHPWNKTIILNDVVQDGFVFNTVDKEIKFNVSEINSNVAATMLWTYLIGERTVVRQVRFEGKVEQQNEDIGRNNFDRKETFFLKTRNYIAKQTREFEESWLDDVFKKDTNDGNPCSMYKIIPERFDFYFASGLAVGDRVEYSKQNDNSWKRTRIGC